IVNAFWAKPGPSEPQYSSLRRVTSGKSHNLKGFWATSPHDIVDSRGSRRPVEHPSCNSRPFESTLLGALSLTPTLALDKSITEDAAMADESPAWIQQEERIDHQLVRGIGIPALTANIVSSTIGAGIFVIPATVAKGLGSAAPLAFVCCAT